MNTVFLSSVTVFIVVSYSFVVHWSVGAVLVLMFPILGGFISLLSKKIKAIQGEIFGETNSLAGSTTESLRNIELIKSLGLENQEIGRLNDTNTKILGLELRKVKTVRMLMFLQGTAINFFRACLLFLMLVLVFLQLISLGEFFTLLFYSFFIFSPLGELGAVIAKFQETRASLENFERIVRRKPAPANPRGTSPEILERISFHNVGFTHEGATAPAIEGVSFDVSAGESVAFVGPSRAGKSTLVKLLLGLYAPQEGEIRINDYPRAELNYDSVRKRVGFVLQSIELFAGTIRDNLTFVNPAATDDKCALALQRAQLHELLDRAREGLDTRIGEGGMKLSGGERQRLAIARALLRDPEILIFHEATSSLDSATERAITRTIEEQGYPLD